MTRTRTLACGITSGSAPRIIDITGLASPVTVAPATGRTLFALGEPGNVELFREWAPFVERLTERLYGGAKAQAMFARGAYRRRQLHAHGELRGDGAQDALTELAPGEIRARAERRGPFYLIINKLCSVAGRFQ